MFVLLIVLELIALYILSRRLTQNLFVAIFLLTRSRPIGIGFLSFLFFPGTVLHELAHLFTAEVLGVHTSGLTLVPEGIEKTQVRTGSVSIAQTDPIRRSAIGIAPVVVGLIMLGVISYFVSALLYPPVTPSGGMLPNPLPQKEFLLFSFVPRFATFDTATWLILAGLFYLLFAVSNTMFSSPEDLEGFWPVVIVLALLAAAAYIAGIRVSLTVEMEQNLARFLQSVTTSLGLVTAINLVLFGISKLLIGAVERITKRRLVTPQHS